MLQLIGKRFDICEVHVKNLFDGFGKLGYIMSYEEFLKETEYCMLAGQVGPFVVLYDELTGLTRNYCCTSDFIEENYERIGVVKAFPDDIIEGIRQNYSTILPFHMGNEFVPIDISCLFIERNRKARSEMLRQYKPEYGYFNIAEYLAKIHRVGIAGGLDLLYGPVETNSGRRITRKYVKPTLDLEDMFAEADIKNHIKKEVEILAIQLVSVEEIKKTLKDGKGFIGVVTVAIGDAIYAKRHENGFKFTGDSIDLMFSLNKEGISDEVRERAKLQAARYRRKYNQKLNEIREAKVKAKDFTLLTSKDKDTAKKKAYKSIKFMEDRTWWIENLPANMFNCLEEKVGKYYQTRVVEGSGLWQMKIWLGKDKDGKFGLSVFAPNIKQQQWPYEYHQLLEFKQGNKDVTDDVMAAINAAVRYYLSDSFGGAVKHYAYNIDGGYGTRKIVSNTGERWENIPPSCKTCSFYGWHADKIESSTYLARKVGGQELFDGHYCVMRLFNPVLKAKEIIASSLNVQKSNVVYLDHKGHHIDRKVDGWSKRVPTAEDSKSFSRIIDEVLQSEACLCGSYSYDPWKNNKPNGQRAFYPEQVTPLTRIWSGKDIVLRPGLPGDYPTEAQTGEVLFNAGHYAVVIGESLRSHTFINGKPVDAWKPDAKLKDYYTDRNIYSLEQTEYNNIVDIVNEWISFFNKSRLAVNTIIYDCWNHPQRLYDAFTDITEYTPIEDIEKYSDIKEDLEAVVLSRTDRYFEDPTRNYLDMVYTVYISSFVEDMKTVMEVYPVEAKELILEYIYDKFIFAGYIRDRLYISERALVEDVENTRKAIELGLDGYVSEIDTNEKFVFPQIIVYEPDPDAEKIDRLDEDEIEHLRKLIGDTAWYALFLLHQNWPLRKVAKAFGMKFDMLKEMVEDAVEVLKEGAELI